MLKPAASTITSSHHTTRAKILHLAEPAHPRNGGPFHAGLSGQYGETVVYFLTTDAKATLSRARCQEWRVADHTEYLVQPPIKYDSRYLSAWASYAHAPTSHGTGWPCCPSTPLSPGRHEPDQHRGAILGELAAAPAQEQYGFMRVKESDGAIKPGTVYVLQGRLAARGLVQSRRALDSRNTVPRRLNLVTQLGREACTTWRACFPAPG